MGDLIDRDALRLMKVEECAGQSIEYAMGWKACIEWIKKDVPAVDAVPVVRCVDCQRFFPNKSHATGNVCFKCPPGREREYYCADGERMG